MAERDTRELTLAAGGGQPDMSSGSVFFIGTATTLIRYAGFTILTDPNFLHRHEKVRLGYGLSSRRLTEPALAIADLPPIDFVLLSHMHEDHFDRVAEEHLDKDLPIVTTPHAAKALTTKGFRNTEALDTWSNLTVRKGDAWVRITAAPGKHGPGIMANLLPSVMGSVLEFGATSGETSTRLYITGDTLVIDELKEIPRRYPEIDLALLHLGGTRAFGILITMDAKQGVEALQLVGPKKAIPIHYNDYTVFKSPLEDFASLVEAAGLSDRVHYLSHGETYEFRVR